MSGYGFAGLVERLLALDASEITLPRVGALVSDTRVDDGELRPYIDYHEDRYARHLVHRSDLFDVIVLCWGGGQVTPVHDHSGQLGWVRVVRGTLAETAFAPAGGAARERPADDPCLALAPQRLVEAGSAVVDAGPAVVTVDPVRAIHRLGNPEASERSVSLHVYSKPHDACRVFDLDTGRVGRRELSFDSQPD